MILYVFIALFALLTIIGFGSALYMAHINVQEKASWYLWIPPVFNAAVAGLAAAGFWILTGAL